MPPSKKITNRRGLRWRKLPQGKAKVDAELPSGIIEDIASDDICSIQELKEPEITSDVNENIDAHLSISSASIDERINMKRSSITQLLIFPEETSHDNISDSMERGKAVDPINIKQVLHGLPSMKTQMAPSRNYICTLCAASSESSRSYTSIKQFAKMIEEFAGVDVLKLHSLPVACSLCSKQLRMVQNFKKQILYTSKLISTTNIMEEFKVNDELFSGALRSTLDCSSDPNEKQMKNADLQAKEKENFDDDDWFRWDLEEDNSEVQIVEVETILNKNLSTEEERSNRFMCAECGKQYSRLYELEKHKYVHGEGKYLCDFCGSTFFYEINLIRHLRTHSGEKPYTCSHCERKFSQKWNHNQHLRIHTNSRPYKCKMCPKAYRHNVSLKTHVAKSHSALECAYSATKSDSGAGGNNSRIVKSNKSDEKA